MNDYGYGLWFLVVVNTAVILIFAASFFHYGVPLTIYLLSGVGGSVLAIDLTHNGGHLWAQLIGWQGDPHLSPFHLASYGFVIGGFWLIAAAWSVLYRAQKTGILATDGPYARIRHPQYTGFILIMAGFLLQWPTLPTLVMFPVLLYFYRRLAMREEQEVRERFGAAWDRYAAGRPRFVPRRGRRASPPASAGRPASAPEGVGSHGR